MQQEKFDYLFKIIVIGDTNVGKTNIISRLVKDEFVDRSKPTIGVGFSTKAFKFGDTVVEVQFWDTAGQERYRALTSAYYRGSSGAIVVYDITNKHSFEHGCTSWIGSLEAAANANIPMMLLGNKMDLKEERKVLKSEAEKMAIEKNMAFFETSALSGENVQMSFEIFVKNIYENEISKEKLKVKKAILDRKSGRVLEKKKKSRCC